LYIFVFQKQPKKNKKVFPMKKYLGLCLLLSAWSLPSDSFGSPVRDIIEHLPSLRGETQKVLCMRNQAYDALNTQDQAATEGSTLIAWATGEDKILNIHGGLSSFQNRFMSDMLPNRSQEPSAFEEGAKIFCGHSPGLKEDPDFLAKLSWGSDASFDEFIQSQMDAKSRDKHLESWGNVAENVTASKKLDEGFVLGAYSGLISLVNASKAAQNTLSAPADDAALGDAQSSFAQQHHDVFAQEQWKKRLSGTTESRKVIFDIDDRRFAIDPWPHEDALTRIAAACGCVNDTYHHTKPCAWKPNVGRFVVKQKGLSPMVLFITTRSVDEGESLFVNSFSHEEPSASVPASLLRNDFLMASSFGETMREADYFGWTYQAPQQPSIEEPVAPETKPAQPEVQPQTKPAQPEVQPQTKPAQPEVQPQVKPAQPEVPTLK
jgi:hypothetical protein